MRVVAVPQEVARQLADGETQEFYRPWPTDYRGLLAVQASTNNDKEAGQILAVGKLVACTMIPRQRGAGTSVRNRRNGWLWSLKEVIHIDPPLDCQCRKGIAYLPSSMAIELAGRMVVYR